jgi:hypothetical protein
MILGAVDERQGRKYLKAAISVSICTPAASLYRFPRVGALSEGITGDTRLSTRIAARELFSAWGKIIIIMHRDI